jgi:hypothetical protein
MPRLPWNAVAVLGTENEVATRLVAAAMVESLVVLLLLLPWRLEETRSVEQSATPRC